VRFLIIWLQCALVCPHVSTGISGRLFVAVYPVIEIADVNQPGGSRPAITDKGDLPVLDQKAQLPCRETEIVGGILEPQQPPRIVLKFSHYALLRATSLELCYVLLSVGTFPQARAPNNGVAQLSALVPLSPETQKTQFRPPLVPNHHLVLGRRF